MKYIKGFQLFRNLNNHWMSFSMLVKAVQYCTTKGNTRKTKYYYLSLLFLSCLYSCSQDVKRQAENIKEQDSIKIYVSPDGSDSNTKILNASIQNIETTLGIVFVQRKNNSNPINRLDKKTPADMFCGCFI